MRRLKYLTSMGLLGISLAAAERIPIASWSFDPGFGWDEVRGFQKSVDGVAGKALRFDGQTTAVVRPAAKMPRISGAFSVEAWVALQTYPWTWCAIANQERDHRAGYFFGVDPEGHFGLQIAVNGGWQECRSGAGLPLYAWNHLLGTFDPAAGLKLYLNGKLVGEKKVLGTALFAPDEDVMIGRNQTPLGLSEEIRVVAPVAYSFDGIIDEVRISDAALNPSEAVAASSRVKPSGPSPLGPPVLPAGPKGPGRFGAYYTRLRYAEEWENPWRVGDAADVVVRFDETPNRLVFWRGTSYIPAWVTENGIWYTNEFYETQVPAMATSAEPMADKQALFSHARILESSEARVVVLWRYAPVSVNDDLVNIDPLTGGETGSRRPIPSTPTAPASARSGSGRPNRASIRPKARNGIISGSTT
ncbi:MAG: LamG domain-containing protein, partial [Candidatus Aminicenantes bacterium]|nr:LamG domain-containing protein [Candidatus Aminicenantes bacterium]